VSDQAAEVAEQIGKLTPAEGLRLAAALLDSQRPELALSVARFVTDRLELFQRLGRLKQDSQKAGL
jgi:hypothetical protein